MPPDSRTPPAWVRLIERIATVLALASGLAIILLMVFTTLDVTLRKAAGSGIPGTIEITEIVLVGVVFLAIMAAELGDVHVRTPILVERLRGRKATIARLIGLIIAFSYSAFAAWLTLGQAISSTQRGEFRFGVAFVPVWPAKLLIPLGFAGLALALLVKIVAKIVELNPHARPLVLSDASSIVGVAQSEADFIAQAVTTRDDADDSATDRRRREEEVNR